MHAMLVEAAWQAVRGPGPLRAFYERIARRRGNRSLHDAATLRTVALLGELAEFSATPIDRLANPCTAARLTLG